MNVTLAVFDRIANRRPKQFSLPADERVYVIGNLNGDLEVLDRLILMIRADDAIRTLATSRLILLGNIIGKGADSRAVLDRLMSMPEGQVVSIAGRNEDVLRQIKAGNSSMSAHFHFNGGRSTLLSFGVSAAEYDGWPFDQLARGVREAMPERYAAYIGAMPPWWSRGDYFFASAGVRPGCSLEDQTLEYTAWTDRNFLRSGRYHGAMIVHSSQSEPGVVIRSNRISVNSAPAKNQRVYALALQGTQRWVVQA